MYPILFRIGDFELRSYGVMIAIAFGVSTWLSGNEAERRGTDPEIVYDFLLYAMVAGIIGARLYYVLFSEPAYFLANPSEIFAVWRGGIAIHGGLLGALAAAIFFCRQRGISFWDFGDLLAPAIILGQGIGRGACTLNGCSFGRPTDLPWGVVFTNPDSMAPLNVALHPTQFYELFGDLCIFMIIWSTRKKMHFKGQLFLIYGMMYGVLRFIIEHFRNDSLTMGNLKAAQVISIVIFTSAVFFYFQRKSNPLYTIPQHQNGMVPKKA